MDTLLHKLPRSLVLSLALFLFSAMEPVWAVVEGISGPTFNLTAKADYISAGDGASIYSWGYANGNGNMQYPGPTLIVNQGDTVTVNLSNQLPVPVSIVFPGQQGVVASGGSAGIMTREVAASNGSVSYTFVASQPGTYLYHSGTQPALQVEMGLLGTLVVRPSAIDPLHQAYSHPDTRFDHEYLFLLTEMDPAIHDQVAIQAAAGSAISADTSAYHPVLWFINGRTAPDTLLDANVPWLPNQPYNCLPRMHPGDRLLMRVVNAGRDLHPLHTHGNNFTIIAHDGRMLESAPGAGPDLGQSEFTLRAVPGETFDTIFEWTGERLGWDMYGHTSASDPMEPHEYAPDHGKPIPVVLPNLQDLSFGAHYSGSPFLGNFGALPPGGALINLNAGYFHMWHSHNEREIVNNDIFPGGMMTMLVIEPPSAPIP
ncbi:MAG: multicopper oxidase family protein [Sideroxydans sp.]|nr:multicopper oxidase family protein [Sideroxydans sp.]